MGINTKMMYTNNAGISYYKRGKHYFKNSGWLEREINKEEYEQAICIILKEMEVCARRAHNAHAKGE